MRGPGVATVAERIRTAYVHECSERSSVRFRMQEEAVPSGNCRRDWPEPRFAGLQTARTSHLLLFSPALFSSSLAPPSRSSLSLSSPLCHSIVTNYRSLATISMDGCPTTKIELRAQRFLRRAIPSPRLQRLSVGFTVLRARLLRSSVI